MESSISSRLFRQHKPGGIRELLVIALPMVVSQACDTLMLFTDRLFLSWISPTHMAAAMGGGLTYFMFSTFAIGLTGYSNALVAQHLGAKQKDKCALAITQAMILAVIFSPIIMLCIPLGEMMFTAMRVDPEQMRLQLDYFNILMYGAVLGLGRCCLSCFFSGIGRTRVVMVASAVSLVVNAGMNYTLIFGLFGLPAMGIRGAAIGTLIGSASGLAVLVFRYFSPAYRTEYQVAASLRYCGELMRKLLRLGTPAGLEFFLNMLAFNLLVMNFHSYGKDVAAATTIAFNWDMVSFVPLIGMCISVTSMVGRYMGAQNPELAHKSAMSGLKLSCCYTAITCALFCFCPEILCRIFLSGGSNGEILDHSVFMVRLVGVYVFADAVILTLSGALRGAGDTFWTMCISVGGHWGFALTAIAMTQVFGFGFKPTWVSFVCFVLLVSLMFWLRYRSGKWKTLKVVDEAAPPHEEQEIHL